MFDLSNERYRFLHFSGSVYFSLPGYSKFKSELKPSVAMYSDENYLAVHSIVLHIFLCVEYLTFRSVIRSILLKLLSCTAQLFCYFAVREGSNF